MIFSQRDDRGRERGRPFVTLCVGGNVIGLIDNFCVGMGRDVLAKLLLNLTTASVAQESLTTLTLAVC